MSTQSPSKPDLLRLVPRSAKSTSASASRLHLDGAGSHQGALDGAWWPQSRNPAAELPGLIASIDATRGQVVRLVLAATGWDERPRRVVVGDRTVSVDYFGSQPATLLTAICAESRVDLLVIPPAAGNLVAEAAMIHARSTGNRIITARRPAAPAATPTTWQVVWEGAQRSAREAAQKDRAGVPSHDPLMAGAAAARLS